MTELFTNPSSQYLRDNVVWIAQLNDGQLVYRKDYPNQPSSWLNLKRYLDENRDKYILDLSVMFRDNRQFIGRDANFFFFTYKVLGNLVSGSEHFFFVAGCGNEINKISCKHFRVPELLIVEEDDRDGREHNRGTIAHPNYIGLFEEYYDD